MNIDTAITLVGQIHFWPGWKLTATDHTDRFEDSIVLRVDYPALNTNRDHARQGYDEDLPGGAYASFPINVSNMTDDDLYRAVIDILLRIGEHEAREAFRVGDTYWAPFHPHHTDGIERWGGDAHLDYLFGVA